MNLQITFMLATTILTGAFVAADRGNNLESVPDTGAMLKTFADENEALDWVYNHNLEGMNEAVSTRLLTCGLGWSSRLTSSSFALLILKRVITSNLALARTTVPTRFRGS